MQTKMDRGWDSVILPTLFWEVLYGWSLTRCTAQYAVKCLTLVFVAYVHFTFTGKICVICSTESMLLSGNGSLVSKRQCIHCSQSSASHSSRISKSSIAAASSSPSSVTTKHHLVKSIYAAWHTTIITIMYLRLISQFSFNGPNFSGSFSLMQLRVQRGPRVSLERQKSKQWINLYLCPWLSTVHQPLKETFSVLLWQEGTKKQCSLANKDNSCNSLYVLTVCIHLAIQ